MTESEILGMIVVLGTLPPALAAVLVAKFQAKNMRAKVGVPNGHGNVVQMLEAVLMKLGGLEERLEAHIGHGHQHRRDDVA